MSEPTRLIPLLCIRCNTPIPAQVNEAAWVCESCGQGQQLGAGGLQALDVHFSAGIATNQPGKPFWVTTGRVTLKRSTYKGDESRSMTQFWAEPRRFFIPAYDLPIEELLETGGRLLTQPPVLESGSPAPFVSVIYSPQDVRSLAEFIVMSLEAQRRDNLRELRIKAELDPPELWILP